MRKQSFQLWKARVNLGSTGFTRGFTILEIVATTAITAILGASLMVGLLAARKSVATARVINSARLILQRNVDQALNVPLLSNVTTKPPILAITTGSSGETYNSEGTNGANSDAPNIPILFDSNGNVLLSGTLTRIVAEEPIPATVSAFSDVTETKLLRVTFKIEFEYLGRDHSHSLSTIRSQDDQ